MAIHLRNLIKRYIGPDGSVVPVIDVASLELADGEQMALIGTSGSGKTTLLHLIAGILTADSGSILFGSDIDFSADAASGRKALAATDASGASATLNYARAAVS